MKKAKQVDGETMKVIMRSLTDTFPGLGFVVLTFEFGEPNKSLANYISNANRSDVVTFLRETANRIDKGTDYMTPTNN